MLFLHENTKSSGDRDRENKRIRSAWRWQRKRDQNLPTLGLMPKVASTDKDGDGEVGAAHALASIRHYCHSLISTDEDE